MRAKRADRGHNLKTSLEGRYRVCAPWCRTLEQQFHLLGKATTVCSMASSVSGDDLNAFVHRSFLDASTTSDCLVEVSASTRALGAARESVGNPDACTGVVEHALAAWQITASRAFRAAVLSEQFSR